MELSQADQEIASRLGNAQSILDGGCGDGRLTYYLAKKTGCEVIGVDLSQSGFRKAKKLAYKASVKHLVRCIKGDATHLNFPNGQFDVAILSHSLHHIEDPPAALREVYRVLRSGGTIMVSEHELKEKGTKSECYHFTLTELTETLLEAGFGGIWWWQGEGDMLVVASK